MSLIFFLSNDAPPTELYPLSLHDALPISEQLLSRSPAISSSNIESRALRICGEPPVIAASSPRQRSEEHTSELQSRFDLVCRLLLEKKKQEKEEVDNLPSSMYTHRMNHRE